ncbi:hypothetical protein K490DRAFT_47747 [Saccharata proteae CBS 121410]|uniref:Uncharacterized protein n=1 Tax=Saccharata proteae CBS 121410 TaxID=1314787 RepID=A0A9P4LV90_9PEZI|nr:hypothetical protein K490DRAFT_47747 [Saccharata proteae CBS 121410]
MAGKATKRSNGNQAKATKPSTASDDTPPAPFTLAPSILDPFLDTLDTQSVYITHIDNHPWWFKRRIFCVPLLLNLGIVCLLAWRAYAVLPTYFEMLLSALGNHNAYTVYPAKRTWSQLALVCLKRGSNFLLDYVLVMIVSGWPITFFLESPGNPVSWRWQAGFRDREIYVRKSRGWGKTELLDATSGKRGQESPFFATRILPAIDRHLLRSKTGYLLMDKSWDLDFAAMKHATGLVDSKKVFESCFEKSVFVWAGEGTGWCVWEVHRLDEGAEEDGRKKIIAFKDTLTALGKESLFFRWIELVQYESSQPGGFTEERQQRAVKNARELFERDGVDFEEFVASVGGMGGMPGFEGIGS